MITDTRMLLSGNKIFGEMAGMAGLGREAGTGCGPTGGYGESPETRVEPLGAAAALQFPSF
jgi:hypothetical protein